MNPVLDGGPAPFMGRAIFRSFWPIENIGTSVFWVQRRAVQTHVELVLRSLILFYMRVKISPQKGAVLRGSIVP